jgi:hypothetical protein
MKQSYDERENRKAYSPDSDGIDHINIYSKGKTKLGRWLSNFTRQPIETKDGHFDSIEGYWYWLLTDFGNLFKEESAREELRHLSGWKAKAKGREILEKVGRTKEFPFDYEAPEFRRKIIDAFILKLKENVYMASALAYSDKPLTHYYAYGDKVITPSGCGWIIDTWQLIADYLRERLETEDVNINQVKERLYGEGYLRKYSERVKEGGSIIQRLGLRSVRHGR